MASAKTTSRKKKGKKHPTSKGLTIVMILAVFFYILTSSIAFPILCKPFYYAQIENLKIEEETGYTREQIVTAYSEVVDFCIGAREDFAVGELKYSEEGKDHFADCRKLFILDLGVLAVSGLTLICWLIIRKAVSMRCARPRNHSVGYHGALTLLITFAVIGALGTIDFDKTFVIFHSLFFPGKTNWLFNPVTDEVINILPETFFMRCGIAIVGLILVQSLIFIIIDSVERARKK